MYVESDCCWARRVSILLPFGVNVWVGTPPFGCALFRWSGRFALDKALFCREHNVDNISSDDLTKFDCYVDYFRCKYYYYGQDNLVFSIRQSLILVLGIIFLKIPLTNPFFRPLKYLI